MCYDKLPLCFYYCNARGVCVETSPWKLLFCVLEDNFGRGGEEEQHTYAVRVLITRLKHYYYY